MNDDLLPPAEPTLEPDEPTLEPDLVPNELMPALDPPTASDPDPLPDLPLPQNDETPDEPSPQNDETPDEPSPQNDETPDEPSPQDANGAPPEAEASGGDGVQAEATDPDPDQPSMVLSPTAGSDDDQMSVTDVMDTTAKVVRGEIGNEAKNHSIDVDRIDFRRLTDDELKEAERLFIPPAGYATWDEDSRSWMGGSANRALDNSDNVLFVIEGEDGSGKTFLAKHFATLLLARWVDEDRIATVYLYNGRGKSLLDIVNDNAMPRDAVIIVQQVFSERGIQESEVSSSFLQSYRNALLQKNTRIILTTTSRAGDLDLPVELCFSTQDIDPSALYDRYVDEFFKKTPSDMYQAQRDELRQRRADVLRDIQAQDRGHGFRPFRIKKYLESLRGRQGWEREPYKSDDVLQKVAREWFEKLPLNYKLYALLVVLCKDISIYVLEYVYEQSVDQLRQAGMDGPSQLIDPRRISSSDMRFRIGLKREGDTLQFENSDYQAEAAAQIENYHRLLWSLSAWFGNFIKHAPDGAHQERRILERAIAQIGIFHWDRLRAYLDDIAHSDQGYVAVSVAFTLGFIAEQRDEDEFILALLDQWAQSKDPDLTWACAAGVWRLHNALVLGGGASAVSAQNIRSQPQLTRSLQRTWAILVTLCEHYHEIQTDRISDLSDSIFREINEALQRSEAFQALSDADKQASQQTVRAEVAKEIDSIKQRYRNQTRKAILITLARIAESSPAHIVSLLREWLQTDGESAVWQMGRNALVQVFNESHKTDALLLSQRCFPLLKLLPVTLLPTTRQMTMGAVKEVFAALTGALTGQSDPNQSSLASATMTEPIDAALDALTQWYETAIGKRTVQPTTQKDERESQDYEDDDDEAVPQTAAVNVTPPAGTLPPPVDTPQKLWEDAVYPELLHTVNHADQRERALLRQALAQKWADSAHAPLRKIAFMLIARSHIMDGSVMDLPPRLVRAGDPPARSRYGIIVLDASRQAENIRSYIDSVFIMVQRLSALAPIRVHHLGTAADARQSGQSSATLLTTQDMRLAGTRPSLLLPVLEHAPDVLQHPEQIYFIAVMNVSPILDMADFLETVAPTEIGIVQAEDLTRLSPIKRQLMREEQGQRERDQAALLTAHQWTWRERIFFAPFYNWLLPVHADTRRAHPAYDQIMLDALQQSGTITLKPREGYSKELIEIIEARLREQIASRLRTLTAQQWWDDLTGYDADLIRDPEDTERVIEQLEQWVTHLNQVEKAQHPKDVTLTISWSLLGMAQRPGGLPRVVELVVSWLHKGTDIDLASAPDEERERAQLYQQMGSAATRLLFNFYAGYGVDGTSPAAQPETHTVLLQLLPPMLALRRGYGEYSAILDIILGWAEDVRWSRRLVQRHDDATGTIQPSELITALRLVRSKQDVRWLSELVERHENFSHAVELFLMVGRPNAIEFFEQAGRAQQWNKAVAQHEQLVAALKTSARRGRKPSLPSAPVPPDGMSTELARDLLWFESLEENERNWIAQQIRRRQQSLTAKPQPGDVFMSAFKNQANVLAQLTQIAQSRIEGRLPRLASEEDYGLIFYDASLFADLSLKADERALPGSIAYRFMQVFHRTKLQGRGQQIALVLHRLGRVGIVGAHQGRGGLKLKESDLRQQSHRAVRFSRLIGPALARHYDDPDRIAFVLIITAAPVLDFDDWADEPGWQGKFWICSLPHKQRDERFMQWNPTEERQVALSAKQDRPHQTVIDDMLRLTLQTG